MKKLLSALASLLLFASYTQAQTNSQWSDFLNFLGSSSNLMVATYGIVNTHTHKPGEGIALAYRLSDYVVAVTRMEYKDHRLWGSSLSLQLQVPVAIGPATIVPLAYAGIDTAWSGKGDENLNAQSIVGTGVAIRTPASWKKSKLVPRDLLVSVEKVSDEPGKNIRFGALWDF